jgi:hypothetical protein
MMKEEMEKVFLPPAPAFCLLSFRASIDALFAS